MIYADASKMKLQILFAILSLFITTTSWGKNSIRSQVLEVLPKELSSLGPEITRKDLEIKFSSKIIKKDQSETLFLSYFDDKNDVSIGTKQGYFSYLYVELPKEVTQEKPDLFKSILGQLSQEEKKKNADRNERDISHEKGRYIIIDLPREGLKLEFLNNEKKLLHSVIVFPLEKK